jgi:hypothetical protein
MKTASENNTAFLNYFSTTMDLGIESVSAFDAYNIRVVLRKL